METTLAAPAAEQDLGRQYGIGRILGIWAAAALPMGLILWVVMPALLPHLTVDPGLVYLVLITAGLVWQGVVALLVLRAEVRPFTWAGVRRRLRLNVPVQPRTGRPSARLLWWTVPAILFLAAWDNLGVLGSLNDAWVRALPFLAPPDWALIENLAEPAKGQWRLLGVLPVLLRADLGVVVPEISDIGDKLGTTSPRSRSLVGDRRTGGPADRSTLVRSRSVSSASSRRCCGSGVWRPAKRSSSRRDERVAGRHDAHGGHELLRPRPLQPPGAPPPPASP